MLGPDGRLPVGGHQVSVEQFEAVFVHPFPDSKTRARLFMRWQRHLAALEGMVTVYAQWIDGSYVTDRVDPADIDLVTVIDGPEYDNLAPTIRDMVDALLSGKATKAVWGIDAYAVLRYPDGHALAALSQQASEEWQDFWQSERGREQDGAVKGYLEVLR